MNPETIRKIAKWNHEKRETTEGTFEMATPFIPEWVSSKISEQKAVLNVFGALKEIHDNKNSNIHDWVFNKGNLEKFTTAFIGRYGIEKQIRSESHNGNN